MKRNNAQNSSAKKKLIPAVAMFTASAVMLSTATYAWFTMNKNAKVTGLNMTATAGGSIEISLGQFEDGKPVASEGAVTAPKMNNKSWKNVVAVSEYYSTVGKLKPASSINANDLFYVDDSQVYAGGMEVNDATEVHSVTAANEAKLTLSDGTTTELKNDNTETGYYVDVPVWIRTTKQTDQVVKCDVTINDANMDGSVDGKELQKAIRVAVIPMSNASKIVNGADTSADAIAKSNSYTDKGTISVFATDYTYYKDNDAAAKGGNALSKTKVAGTAATYDSCRAALKFAQQYVAKTEFPNDTEENYEAGSTLFTLTKTSGDEEYSVQPFVVRVWLEGESTSCKDANASQDWNIQLNFSGADKVGE